MEKVISINLNGNAYHLEERGYQALRRYLDDAGVRLQENPGRAEILADLEQAVAEKCAAYLGPHKTVVTTAEVERIVAEMGPVRDPDAGERAGEPGEPKQEPPREPGAAPRRLYQIREGAVLTGVCNGLAAYFNIDVTIVRVVFVILTVLTKGAWAVVYIALSFFIPFANTAEERAAAHGQAFNAQELIDRAKQHYRHQQRGLRRQLRHARRGWHGYSPGIQQQVGYAAQVWARAAASVFGILNAGLFVVLALAIVSLVNEGNVFGWTPPPSLPLWAGVLILVVIFQILTAPLHALRYALAFGYAPPQEGVHDAFGGLITFAALLFAFWILYQYVPDFREFVQQLPTIGRDVWQSLTQR